MYTTINIAILHAYFVKCNYIMSKSIITNYNQLYEPGKSIHSSIGARGLAAQGDRATRHFCSTVALVARSTASRL